ncbi:hypothetical protein UFOVP347_22 [uncultured Caudovirales phage]|uniref:dATP/dGTP diphosphohydrolase N-terminal domain-containing protein n=1 Tax=uncultured Caudovirales phage TaxID=2100421 RepID=A0A6J5LZF3_9CAUD|nr:hypothetical protein UFOVP347_22 [uncultured Caudovirales phage]
MTSAYPDSNPKTAVGLTKPSFGPIPPVALLHMADAMRDGKAKYGLMNWREHQVSSSVYYDAALRHLLAWWDGQDNADDSKCHHLAHAMACFAIVLDAQAAGKLNDDRPAVPGKFPDGVKARTQETTPPTPRNCPCAGPHCCKDMMPPGVRCRANDGRPPRA